MRADVDRPVPNSAAQPHRSHDGYHGSYNDYLWQLALADGELPQVAIGSKDEPSRTEPPNTDSPAIEPLVIDQPPSDNRHPIEASPPRAPRAGRTPEGTTDDHL